MEQRKWYEKDIKTSLLGFGCMRFKTNDGKIDEEYAEKLLDIAYQNGVNYYDTAVPYLDGQSEEFLGRVMKKYDRKSYYIATKLPIWKYESSEEIEKAIDEHLDKLQTDYIDFYLLHAMSKSSLEKVKKYGIIEICKKWKEQGKIKNFGFSFHDDYDTFKEILNLYDWDFSLIQFNYMDKDIQQGMKGYQDLVDRKIPIIVMEPLKGGRLVQFNPEIENIYKSYNDDSMVKWALRWAASQKGVMTILSGMNSEEQLNENLDILSNFKQMSNKELELVEKVSESIKKLEVVPCTECGYCMPCPVGVNIPSNFKILNEYAMYKDAGSTKWAHGMLKNKNAHAAECVYCEECIPKCPQQINIPKDLEKIVELMNEIK